MSPALKSLVSCLRISATSDASACRAIRNSSGVQQSWNKSQADGSGSVSVQRAVRLAVIQKRSAGEFRNGHAGLPSLPLLDDPLLRHGKGLKTLSQTLRQGIDSAEPDRTVPPVSPRTRRDKNPKQGSHQQCHGGDRKRAQPATMTPTLPGTETQVAMQKHHRKKRTEPCRQHPQPLRPKQGKKKESAEKRSRYGPCRVPCIDPPKQLPFTSSSSLPAQ